MPDERDSGTDAGWKFDNSYARLPETLFSRVAPVPVRQPGLVLFNERLAASLGLDVGALNGPEGAGIFAGNLVPPGAEPLAQAYAGHQFGHFTNLGDGRAVLLGEQITPTGARFDIQLKGSGPTPYSRRGDGRAVLGPMVREYIISEAMHALGIPTTRSLAVATTGEPVFREEALPGAVLTRVAASHVRVGTFEYATATGDRAALTALLAHTITRHYPELEGAENPALALLGAAASRQASLVARWMQVGFIHGVMNTDNMALSGETIDYGPCAFMDAFDEATVFSSIDRHGRYAYGNQPRIAQWNLARLAEGLLPLIAEKEEEAIRLAEGVLGKFADEFQGHWLEGFRSKLGLFTAEAGDEALIRDLLALMKDSGADFTNTFIALAKGDTPEGGGWTAWMDRWKARLASQPQTESEVIARMRSVNPAVIPRNHRVEEALAAAMEGDFSKVQRLVQVLSDPFAETMENEAFRKPPPSGGEPYRTFCGT
ncbi:MAG: YdiU family protein [Chthoniobacterales bacterium]|nr:YdiU family protein [Chthoniobacterales bacterium]